MKDSVRNLAERILAMLRRKWGAKEDEKRPSPAALPKMPPFATPGDTIENDWYFMSHGVSHGPMTRDELVAMARQGAFSGDDLVYGVYVGGWVRADSVHGLFDDVSPLAHADAAAKASQTGPTRVPGVGYPPGYSFYVDEYAGFWLRFAAAFVDWAVLLAPCFCASVAGAFGAGRMGYLTQGPASMLQTLARAAFSFGVPILAVVGGWLYFAVLESSAWQATPGKRAVGIMVTDLLAQRISFGRATARFFASWAPLAGGFLVAVILLSRWDFAPLVPLVAAFAGWLMCAFERRKRTFHDIVAGTVVIEGRM